MLDWLIPPAYAQEGAPSPAAGAIGNLIFFFAVILIFWLLVWRPQQRRVREHQQMIRALQKGDSIVTSGGIHGRVVAVEDRTLMIEIAPNVRVRVQKENVAGKISATGEAAITEPK